MKTKNSPVGLETKMQGSRDWCCVPAHTQPALLLWWAGWALCWGLRNQDTALHLTGQPGHPTYKCLWKLHATLQKEGKLTWKTLCRSRVLELANKTFPFAMGHTWKVERPKLILPVLFWFCLFSSLQVRKNCSKFWQIRSFCAKLIGSQPIFNPETIHTQPFTVFGYGLLNWKGLEYFLKCPLGKELQNSALNINSDTLAILSQSMKVQFNLHLLKRRILCSEWSPLIIRKIHPVDFGLVHHSKNALEKGQKKTKEKTWKSNLKPAM